MVSVLVKGTWIGTSIISFVMIPSPTMYSEKFLHSTKSVRITHTTDDLYSLSINFLLIECCLWTKTLS